MKSRSAPTIDLDTGKIVPDGPTPSAIAAINALHRRAEAVAGEARAKTEEAAHLAILVGLRLRALRPTVPHGGWEKLFTSATRRLNAPASNKKPAANVEHVRHFDFSYDTARNYISAAERIMEQRLTRKKALALQGLAGKDTLAEADRKLLNEASRGETLRQLYFDLGIIKPTKDETILRNRNTKGGPTKAEQAAKNPPESVQALKDRDAVESCARLMLDMEDFEKQGHGLRLSRKSLDKLREAVRQFADSLATINA